MKRRGLTLIELLLAATISAFIVVSVAGAYVTGINFEKGLNTSHDRDEAKVVFESRITNLIKGAFVTSDTADLSSYFVAQATADAGSTVGADTLTFTTTSEGVNSSLITSEDDFETLNQKYGPQGGLAEVSLSVTPVGDPAGKSGLFLREQRPSDGDATQGGYETLLSPDVTTIGFEFYDGTDWATEWDTLTDGTRRIPAAVRVTYTLSGEEDTNHVILVRLANSDVTAINPVTVAGGTTAG